MTAIRMHWLDFDNELLKLVPTAVSIRPHEIGRQVGRGVLCGVLPGGA